MTVSRLVIRDPLEPHHYSKVYLGSIVATHRITKPMLIYPAADTRAVFGKKCRSVVPCLGLLIINQIVSG